MQQTRNSLSISGDSVASGGRVLAVNGGGRGRLSFTPAPGLDHRTVIAQFELAGVPAETVRVASFTPLSPRLGRVNRLKLSRHGLALAVSWNAVPGATGYELVARLAVGGERMVRTHGRAISLGRIARYDSGVVSVRAVATLRQGAPARAHITRVAAVPTRLGRLPRLSRRR